MRRNLMVVPVTVDIFAEMFVLSRKAGTCNCPFFLFLSPSYARNKHWHHP